MIYSFDVNIFLEVELVRFIKFVSGSLTPEHVSFTEKLSEVKRAYASKLLMIANT